jgi:hypothetical protein
MAINIAKGFPVTATQEGGITIDSPSYSVRRDQILVAVASVFPTSTTTSLAEIGGKGGKISWSMLTGISNATTQVIWLGVPNNDITGVVTELTLDTTGYDGILSIWALNGASSSIDGAIAQTSSGSGAAQVVINAKAPGSMIFAVIGDGTLFATFTPLTNNTKDFEFGSIAGNGYCTLHYNGTTQNAGNLSIGTSAPTGHQWGIVAAEIFEQKYVETEVNPVLIASISAALFASSIGGRSTVSSTSLLFNILDFGEGFEGFGGGSNEASFTVIGQTGIASNSHIEAWFHYEDYGDGIHTAADNAYASQSIQLTCGNIIPGVGFTIYGRSLEKITGRFKVRWFWV